MRGIEALFEMQKFLARSGLPPEFTVTLAADAWDSLLAEAGASDVRAGWFARPTIEVMGTSGVMRVVGPHGYIDVERRK